MAELRRENDYGEAAEEVIAAKRCDYFAAGTLVMWDVDVLKEEVVRVIVPAILNSRKYITVVKLLKLNREHLTFANIGVIEGR